MYNQSSLAVRIIPALAGNTTLLRPPAGRDKDHPRSRGEYGNLAGDVDRAEGSSPLSRGILTIGQDIEGAHGIIPALAGNTPSPGSSTTPSGDHPRSRGEYFIGSPTCSVRGGSSPLSRGIPGRSRGEDTAARIIPALAGNTDLGKIGAVLDADHPRSRGEYPNLDGCLARSEGSSPLSRGILPG